MDVPQSMKDELTAWQQEDGSIDLDFWMGINGSLSLAIGYSTIFWPEFERIEGYILRKGTQLDQVRLWEEYPGSSRQSVEGLLNHVHLLEIHGEEYRDASADKLVALSNVLADIYRAKLAWQFPDQPCKVIFDIPDNREDLISYQLTFWQVSRSD